MPADGTGEAGAGPEGPRPRGDYFVQSLERGLAVIKAFTAEEPELTLSDIARRTGMTRAAARRFVLTLLDLGYVGTVDRRFHLRPSVLELGYPYLSTLSFPQVATPHLTALSARLNETTSLAVLDGSDIVYVARVGARRVWSSGLTVGTRLAAYLTTHGRVQLAALPDDELDAYLAGAELESRTSATVTDPEQLRRVLMETRASGYSLVDQELEEGMVSLAVPVRDGSGRVVASVNVGTQSRRHSAEELVAIALDPLRETARQIERDIALMGPRIAPPGQF
ncbi:IclR family transcriptional regulator domain-containing protein [Geodermatophilus sabuli]|uniref:Transcriptional regulator, IclR family n=1 Tax=Geodermatophilus sabuli TaxID=1564158 RepID=A0A285ELT1_9ACTN|nr:IclR family transcriptional regulator C-terminal domain-containing protein [Geodermatophilus sabuli]MBB3083713.1 IclR family pca regulon transcriptional regulator [Geodermatophilus sabuli]SNX99144.1 transcriptional regulator, IclR family [Geodermatophilus sabuli]